MREIKFQAVCQHKETGRILVQNYRLFQEPALPTENYFWLNDRLLFTGLKDKNGKEMYEGCVVRNEDSFGCSVSWGDGGDEYPDEKIIVWDEAEARFKFDFIQQKYRGRGVSGYTLCEGNAKHFEVIGNVYANPELLDEGGRECRGQ